MNSIFLGEIRPFAGHILPSGWLPCDGRTLTIADYRPLYEVIGTAFGSAGDSGFLLPNLQGRAVVGTGQGLGLSAYHLAETGGRETVTLTQLEMPGHQHDLRGAVAATVANGTASPVNAWPAIANHDVYAKLEVPPTDHMAAGCVTGNTEIAGGGLPHDNMQPSVAVLFCVATTGIKPQDYVKEPPAPPVPTEIQPYVGQVVTVGFDFIPEGFVRCEGQLLPIEGNRPLFALCGTSFGGDGQTTFGVPDLRARLPIGARPEIRPGQTTGTETVALTAAQLPKHQHSFEGSIATGDDSVTSSPAYSYPASGPNEQFSTQPAEAEMAANSLTGTTASAGGSAPHENRQPFIALHYLLATGGYFPSHP